jgi:hypothetical protein
VSYRDPLEALRARRDRLTADLIDARHAVQEASDRARRVGSLENELEALDRMVAGYAERRALPLLDDLRVAAPCKAKWDDMAGDDRVRFCAQCAKNVFNVSAMPRKEAEAMLAGSAAPDLCVRFYRRADGTVLSGDCAVGVRRRRRRRGIVGAIAGLLASASALAFAGYRESRVTMGARAWVPPPPIDVRQDGRSTSRLAAGDQPVPVMGGIRHVGPTVPGPVAGRNDVPFGGQGPSPLPPPPKP